MTARRLLALALLALASATACSPEEIEVSSRAGHVCVRLAPHSDQSGYDSFLDDVQHPDYAPEHQTYGTWTGEVDGVRRILGYAATEDSSIWNLPECAIASAK